MQPKLPSSLDIIVQDICTQGGTPYLVGGAVIDSILNLAVKDWDIEIHDLPEQEILRILERYGKAKAVGKSFNIISLRVDGTDYEFSTPDTRRPPEQIDTYTLRDCAMARDLTINSMMLNLADGTLLDQFGGLGDLQAGIIRHTSHRFAEDPLRVLRIMQLLPRKGKTVAAETIEVCRSLHSTYQQISSDRAHGEWSKLLTKAAKPSAGLRFLKDCDWITHYTELYKISDSPAWEKTLQNIDSAAEIKHTLEPEQQKQFMYAMLAYETRHEDKNAPEKLLRRITGDNSIVKYALNYIEYAAMLPKLVREKTPESEWVKIHNKASLYLLGTMLKATGAHDAIEKDAMERCFMLDNKYNHAKVRCLLDGNDLIMKGYSQGPALKQMLEQALADQVDHNIESKEQLLERI